MSLFAGPILGIFLLGILSRRANFAGWLVGCVMSIAVTGYIQYGPKVEWIYYPWEEKVHWIYHFPIAFGITFVVGLIASFIFPSPPVKKELTLWK